MGQKYSLDGYPIPMNRKNTSDTNTNEQPSQEGNKKSPKSSPSSNKSSHKSSSNEDPISNWKLFNDLENREEAEVLELSVFLDALHKYMPGLDEQKLRRASSRGEPDSPPPNAPPSLGKHVSEQIMGEIDIGDLYMSTLQMGEVISLQNALDLIEHCKKGYKIPRAVVCRILTDALDVFRTLPNVQQVTIAPSPHMTIIGDLHGQLDDLLLILRENELPSDTNPYVFNGDFVDRGDRGVEIALIIYIFKLLYPNHVHVNRGNHEDISITQIFGFMKECHTKYDHEIFELFCETFRWLPLATLIDHKVLVLHGGISRETSSLLLKDYQALPRNEYDLAKYRTPKPPKAKNEKEPYRQMCMMRDILWSDPKNSKGWIESKRGAGIVYGPDVIYKFMSKNKLSLIVRSHECVPRGFDWPFEEKGMLVTLFSASNYCGKANNLGCFMRIPSDPRGKPAFFQFMANNEAKDMAVSNLDGLFSLIVEFQEQLLKEFEQADLDFKRHEDTIKAGVLSIVSWGNVLEKVLDLQLDWIALQPLLCSLDQDGNVNYKAFLERYNAQGGIVPDSNTGSNNNKNKEKEIQHLKKRSAFNMLYRHRARLEALFRVLDRDGNGTITLEELEKGIQILNEHLPTGSKQFHNAQDLMRLLDFSHDNQVNINEFMECFRLNAKLTVHAKWKRAKKKIKVLSALGMLKNAMKDAEEILSPHGSVKVLGFDENKMKQLEEEETATQQQTIEDHTPNLSEFEEGESEILTPPLLPPLLPPSPPPPFAPASVSIPASPEFDSVVQVSTDQLTVDLLLNSQPPVDTEEEESESSK